MNVANAVTMSFGKNDISKSKRTTARTAVRKCDDFCSYGERREEK